jgi:dolichol-phosphate mannosyltransferase
VSSGSPRLLVTLATYNERDNLGPLLSEIRQTIPFAEVLIVDDNSPDGTGQLADQWAAEHGWVHVLHRPGKLGLGSALLESMQYAVAQGYDYLINMDADFSHHPRYLPALLAGMDRYDVIVGSRYVPGGGTVNWPVSRRCISLGVNLLVRFLMRMPTRDCSGGFRCYRVARLPDAHLEQMISRGYSCMEEILYRCRRAGLRLGETPIVFETRRMGSSKVNLFEAGRSLGILLWLGVHALLGLDRDTRPWVSAAARSPHRGSPPARP